MKIGHAGGMRRLVALLVLGLVALALSPTEVLSNVEAYLKRAPWQARVVGQVRTPDGTLQKIDFLLKVLPEGDLTRIEFFAPDSVADNVVLITPKKVYNYLFLTNQLVVYPRKKARIEGLGLSLAGVSGLRGMAEDERVRWRLVGEKTTPAGPVYVLEGTPRDPEEAGFGRMEVWVLKSVPRPYRIRVWNAQGELVLDVSWVSFARVPLKRQAFFDFPPDAEVIEK